MNRVAILSVTLLAFCAISGFAQRGTGTGRAGPGRSGYDKPEEGIPVTDPLVVSKCGTCHTKDEKGNLVANLLGAFNARRLGRSHQANGAAQRAQDQCLRKPRSIVKYLATCHGLAPEEAKPVMYMPEHRIVDETNIPNDTVRAACTTLSCVWKGSVVAAFQRRLAIARKPARALYAQAEAHFRRPPGGEVAEEVVALPSPAPAAPRRRMRRPRRPTEPGDGRAGFSCQGRALHTPEWAAWRSRIRAPRISRQMAGFRHHPGHGKYVGEMIIEPGPAEDEFKTTVTMKS